MSLSQSAAARESDAEKELDVSIYPMTNVSQQCHGGEERKKNRKKKLIQEKPLK